LSGTRINRSRGANDNLRERPSRRKLQVICRILGRVMRARPAAGFLTRVNEGLQKGLQFLAARVKALRRAVRVDNIRLAQRLRMGLGLYLKHLEEPLRNDVGRLFEVSGLWVRNIGDRHHTKQQVQRISRRIVQRLDARSNSWTLRRGLSATGISPAGP
jgi:hypothetical protein